MNISQAIGGGLMVRKGEVVVYVPDETIRLGLARVVKIGTQIKDATGTGFSIETDAEAVELLEAIQQRLKYLAKERRRRLRALWG